MISTYGDWQTAAHPITGLESLATADRGLITWLRAVIEHMRALGWYESHLFTHAYLRGALCVGIAPDLWTLSYVITPGIYKIVAAGAALRDLRIALLNAAQIFPEELQL